MCVCCVLCVVSVIRPRERSITLEASGIFKVVGWAILRKETLAWGWEFI